MSTEERRVAGAPPTRPGEDPDGPRPAALYETDFAAWAHMQAVALRAHRWDALDVEHLAEEIEDLGKRDVRALESYLGVILLHLLKWVYQPARRSRSWQKSLLQARHRLDRLLQDHAAYRHPQLLGWLAVRAYPHARRLAALETGLPLATFPENVPWPPAQVLDEDFLPESPP
jgi:Domain of unknown function DUF29